MKAKILTEPPISGEFEEIYFGESTSSGYTWVLFEEDELAEWVGVFAHSGTGNGQDKVAFFNDGEHAFIVAGGQGLVLDVNSKVIIQKTDIDWLYDCRPVPGKNQILACTCIFFVAYSTESQLWETDRLTQDDLTMEQLTEEKVTGICFTGPNYKSFTFYLSDRRFEMGEEVPNPYER